MFTPSSCCSLEQYDQTTDWWTDCRLGASSTAQGHPRGSRWFKQDTSRDYITHVTVLIPVLHHKKGHHTTVYSFGSWAMDLLDERLVLLGKWMQWSCGLCNHNVLYNPNHFQTLITPVVTGVKGTCQWRLLHSWSTTHTSCTQSQRPVFINMTWLGTSGKSDVCRALHFPVHYLPADAADMRLVSSRLPFLTCLAKVSERPSSNPWGNCTVLVGCCSISTASWKKITSL